MASKIITPEFTPDSGVKAKRSRSVGAPPRRAESVPPASNKKTYQGLFRGNCLVCSGTSCGRSHKERMEHCLRHHMGINPYKCTECDCTFVHKWGSKQHAIKKHLDLQAECIVFVSDYDSEKLNKLIKECFLRKELQTGDIGTKLAERSSEEDSETSSCVSDEASETASSVPDASSAVSSPVPAVVDNGTSIARTFNEKSTNKKFELKLIEGERKEMRAKRANRLKLRGDIDKIMQMYERIKDEIMKRAMFNVFDGVDEYLKAPVFEYTLPVSRIVPYTRYKWFGWDFGTTVEGQLIFVRPNLAILFGKNSCHLITAKMALKVDLHTSSRRKCSDVEFNQLFDTALEFARNCVLDKDFTLEKHTKVTSDDHNWLCTKVSVKKREFVAIVPTFDKDLRKIMAFKDFSGVWVVDKDGKVEPIRVEEE